MKIPLVDVEDITLPDQPLDEITLNELAQIMNTRKRWPDYRSDLHIPMSIQQQVADYAARFRDRGSLAFPPSQPDAISDLVAVTALQDSNQNLQVPLSLTPIQNDMRRKMSFPQLPVSFSAYPKNIAGLSGASIRGVGPLVTRSLGMLNAFGAYDENGEWYDDQVDTSGSNDSFTPNASSGFGTQLLNALPSLVTAGTNVYAATQNNNGPQPVTYNPNTGQYTQPQSSNPMNLTMMLVLAGVAVVGFMVLSKRK